MPVLASNFIPEGMHTITPSLWFNGNCKEAIAFYQRAFEAELLGPIAFDSSGEEVMHAMMKIGSSCLMLSDSFPDSQERGPTLSTSISLFLYVKDCDAFFDKAHEAGCEEIMPMTDVFWGDRMGKLRDPFGHAWVIATHKLVMTRDEIYEGMKAWQQEHDHEHDGCC